MTFFAVFAAFLLVMAAGIGASFLLLRETARINLLECAALGWLFGTGIISLLLWSGGLLISGAPLQFGVTVSAIALAVGGFVATRKRRATFAFPRPANAVEWILAIVIAFEFCLLFRCAFGHGLGWDGLLNWEVKARYAFFNDGVIPSAYYRSATRAFTHPAYPLLIPLTELWFYLWMGEAHQFWIKLIFPLYYAAGAILLAATACRLTSARWPGLLVAALLFFVPFLTNSPGDASGGYADVPLGMIYLATTAYLTLYAVNRQPDMLRIFALSLALLPWTKREGTILWLIAAFGGAVVIRRYGRSKRALLWLTPGAVLIAAWKIFLHAMQTTDAREFVPMNFPTLIANISRVIPIFRMVGTEMLATSRWSLFWPCVLLAFAYLCVRARDRRLLLLGVAVAAPVALYSATYLFSIWPDYTRHFDASFSRLLLQVMPIAWLAIALAIAQPSAVSPPPDRSRQSRSR